MSISSAADSPVKTSVTPDEEPDLLENDPDSFGNSCESFAWWDPDTSCWRTYQGCLLPMRGKPWDLFSGPWPRAGMMRNGTVSPLHPSAPIIVETESLSWPTPNKMDGSTMRLVQTIPEWLAQWQRHAAIGQNKQYALSIAVRFDCGKAIDAIRCLRNGWQPPNPSGLLSPEWVTWLMGFPDGWLSASEPSETP